MSTTTGSRLGASGSYRDKGISGYEGSEVDIPPVNASMTYPSPSFQPHGSVFSSVTPIIRPAESAHRLQRPAQTIESWFGSSASEAFENNFIQVSRLVLVDCVTYPFIVFSHQCQLYPYYTATPSLTAPFSTLVVMHSIANSQSVMALWRGWKSHLFLLLAQPFVDALLTKLFLLSAGSRSAISPGHWIRTLVLKSVPHLVTIPLLSYTYQDMVQNTTDKVHTSYAEVIEDRQLLQQDSLRRSIPYLFLAAPTVLHGLVSGALSHLIHKVARRFRTHSDRKSLLTSAVGALWLDFFSMLLTDTLLYPLETILVRLYCQGMPALVDNIQNGVERTFVSSYYRGMMDCVTGVYDSEGPLGFFKGFSSLLIRFSIHAFLLVLLWRTAQALDNRLKR